MLSKLLVPVLLLVLSPANASADSQPATETVNAKLISYYGKSTNYRNSSHGLMMAEHLSRCRKSIQKMRLSQVCKARIWACIEFNYLAMNIRTIQKSDCITRYIEALEFTKQMQSEKANLFA